MAENNVVEVKEKKPFKETLKDFGKKAWDGTKKAAPKILIGLGGFAAGVATGIGVALGISKSPEDEDGEIVSTEYREVDEDSDEDEYDDYEEDEDVDDDEE